MPVKSIDCREVLFTLLLITYFFPFACISPQEPLVKTWLGKIRGSWKVSLSGKLYAAFEGIPYAKPPIKDLRFEEPQEIEPWQGIWSASKLYTCLQMGKKIEGTEDCLYMNVYVPSDYMNLQKTYPVVVYIHGGGFMTGSPHSMSNSKYFMDRDNMIVVTFTYRLGIFGFLSTEDEEVPGNNGMKDQVLALKWAKLNIASFGGNPNAITIAGVSAGGASVHLHYFSHLSKGLFTRGISSSGTALNPWVIKRHPLLNARKLAVLLGCSYSSTKEMKKCFKKNQMTDILEKVKYFYGFGSMPFSPFGPVIEATSSKHPFLAKNPYSLLHQKRVLDAPWITSSCAHEGLLPTAYYYHDLHKIEKDWRDIAHYLLDYNYTVPIKKRKTVAGEIKKNYMGTETITKNSFQNFTKIFTDRLFTISSEMAAKLQSSVNESPVYYYYFNYPNGTNNIAKNYSLKGVSHGEDSIFFYGAFIYTDFSAEDKIMMDTCLDILRAYAATGNPAFGRAIRWKPTKSEDELVYLNITNTNSIVMHKTQSLSKLEFWRKLGLLENERLAFKDEL